MYNARFNKKGNIKLGSMWSWSKLAGDEVINGVQASCGEHCNGCKSGCYVFKSYRYPSVKAGHARNTKAFRDDLKGSFNELRSQIEKARNKPQLIRINQSGEIETPLELLLWCKTAEKYPDINFYIYTKNFKALNMVINTFNNGETMPGNITINISIWHEYGIKEYNDLKHYSFIKAFIYDDLAFNYEQHGIKIETYCTAYDNAGKLNHDITCNKCMKCIKSPFKTIGCYDH